MSTETSKVEEKGRWEFSRKVGQDTHYKWVGPEASEEDRQKAFDVVVCRQMLMEMEEDGETQAEIEAAKAWFYQKNNLEPGCLE